MESSRRQLADPETPLGMIERGRGAGFLWAREHPDEAWPFLCSCLERDPRQPRDEARPRESRAAYYVEMAQAIGFGARELKSLVQARATPATWESRVHDCLPVSVLAGLALAGDDAARALVLELTREGPNWVAILQHLGSAAGSWAYSWAYDSRLAWPELPDVVAARLRESDGGSLLTRTHTDLFLQFATWPLTPRQTSRLVWSEATGWVYETQEEIDDSLAMESAVALTRAAHSSDAAGRALRRTLRQDSRISYFAWVGLGLQGDTGVVVLALEELPKARRHGDGPRTYLEHLPGETTLPIARDLIKRSDEACASMGWQLLAAHGSAADMPVLHAELLRVLAEDDWDDVRTVLRGFIGNLKSGPYPAVQTCFERMPDSQDRERAAWILLFGSPDGADDLAFECLWDCEEETRELAAGVIARKTQEIRERVEAIQTLVSAREHARTSALRARLRAAELPVDRTD